MSNKHPITWVVVADSCQAKVFRALKFPKLEEISFLEHPESRLLNQDLVSSRPGRTFQSMGTARSAYQPETEPKVVEAMKFASELSNFLSLAERNGEFQRLYLFAAPSFLGLLRQHLSPEIHKTIAFELPKELTSSDTATIERHLAEL